MVKLFFQVKAFQLREQFRTIRHYYRGRFAWVDMTLLLVSAFCNPYRVSRKFLQKRGVSDIHAYGETPLSTFAKLAAAAQLTPRDRFVELGSGRGKICFWAALRVGCNARGIEWVPSFVRLSKVLARLFRAPIPFERKTMDSADISDATVVYLYTMEWNESLLERMAPGARLITIGEPAPATSFETIAVVPARFPWGETLAYVQRRLPKVAAFQIIGNVEVKHSLNGNDHRHCDNCR